MGNKKKSVKKKATSVKVKIRHYVEEEITLKNCPFCGSMPEIDEDSEMEFLIKCPECKVEMYNSENDSNNFASECVKRWNTRVK